MKRYVLTPSAKRAVAEQGKSAALWLLRAGGSWLMSRPHIAVHSFQGRTMRTTPMRPSMRNPMCFATLLFAPSAPKRHLARIW